jgi:hypothetical protein
MSPETQAANLLAQAADRRAESNNFLRHSVAAMYQFEADAENLEKRAAELLQITEDLLQLHIAHHNNPTHAHARKVIRTIKGTQ